MFVVVVIATSEPRKQGPVIKMETTGSLIERRYILHAMLNEPSHA